MLQQTVPLIQFKFLNSASISKFNNNCKLWCLNEACISITTLRIELKTQFFLSRFTKRVCLKRGRRRKMELLIKRKQVMENYFSVALQLRTNCFFSFSNNTAVVNKWNLIGNWNLNYKIKKKNKVKSLADFQRFFIN